MSKSRGSVRTRAKTTLMKLLDDRVLTVDFVGAIAGDRPLSEREKKVLEEFKNRRGAAIYSDLLFTLCHQYFPAGKALQLWDQIVDHKEKIEGQLGRKIGITVAAHDYLTNVADVLEQAVIVSEPSMSVVADIALKDGLTRLFDHHSFLQKLDEELLRDARTGESVSLIFIDIDHFKLINDSHGHQVGDQVLARLGQILHETTRTIDICARYGGEEFALLLPNTSTADACRLAERLRQAVEREFAANPPAITISLGIATYPDDAGSADTLLRAADQALYAAKENGRNCLISYNCLS